MDLRALVPLLSVVLSALLNTGVSAPANEVPAASLVSHVRNKRCSCATFLDKECVYFCHLDIIWVNTPERVVSYGLGNTPRKRRSAGDSARTRGAPRCRCVRGRDSACNDFCHPENPLRYDASPGEAIPMRAQGCSGAGCARTLLAAASAPRRKRRASGEDGQRTASRAALRVAAAAKVRGVLQTWRTRRWRPTGEKEEHAAS